MVLIGNHRFSKFKYTTPIKLDLNKIYTNGNKDIVSLYEKPVIKLTDSFLGNLPMILNLQVPMKRFLYVVYRR